MMPQRSHSSTHHDDTKLIKRKQSVATRRVVGPAPTAKLTNKMTCCHKGWTNACQLFRGLAVGWRMLPNCIQTSFASFCINSHLYFPVSRLHLFPSISILMMFLPSLLLPGQALTGQLAHRSHTPHKPTIGEVTVRIWSTCGFFSGSLRHGIHLSRFLKSFAVHFKQLNALAAFTALNAFSKLGRST